MRGLSIVFTRSPGIASRAVRWFTKSAVSHVGIGFTLDGVELVLHAYGQGGVQVQRASKFYADREIVAGFVVLEDVSMGPLLDDLGDRYDGKSIMRHAARRFGLRFRSPSYSPDALVCSELVAQLPIDVFADLEPETATPQDLLDRCLRDEGQLARSD